MRSLLNRIIAIVFLGAVLFSSKLSLSCEGQSDQSISAVCLEKIENNRKVMQYYIENLESFDKAFNKLEDNRAFHLKEEEFRRIPIVSDEHFLKKLTKRLLPFNSQDMEFLLRKFEKNGERHKKKEERDPLLTYVFKDILFTPISRLCLFSSYPNDVIEEEYQTVLSFTQRVMKIRENFNAWTRNNIFPVDWVECTDMINALQRIVLVGGETIESLFHCIENSSIAHEKSDDEDEEEDFKNPALMSDLEIKLELDHIVEAIEEVLLQKDKILDFKKISLNPINKKYVFGYIKQSFGLLLKIIPRVLLGFRIIGENGIKNIQQRTNKDNPVYGPSRKRVIQGIQVVINSIDSILSRLKEVCSE